MNDRTIAAMDAQFLWGFSRDMFTLRFFAVLSDPAKASECTFKPKVLHRTSLEILISLLTAVDLYSLKETDLWFIFTIHSMMKTSTTKW